MTHPHPIRAALAVVLSCCLLGCPASEDEEEVACAVAPLATCVEAYSTALRACVTDSGAACAVDDPAVHDALDALDTDLGDCTVGALDEAATQGRLRNACASEASSLAGRVFGGPQGAVWADAAGNDNLRTCLATIHETAAGLVVDELEEAASCLADDACDAGGWASRRGPLGDAAEDAVDAACELLPNRIGMDAATYVARASAQTDCLAASALSAGAELGLRCGPDHAQFDIPRDEWTTLTIDREVWGTQCADGSDYQFQVYLAPEGERLDRVVIGLQGGGVCLLGEDCATRFDSSPGLFTAADDEPPFTGIMSNEAAESDFAGWTKVHLPYCTQDVFAGGGVDEVFDEITVPRYGAVNLRAAIQMVRDVLWREMDAEGGDGFRPDEVVALFGGWSAGGYGALYNYHWMLDDLQWPRTAAYPDAGLALDNGAAVGVRGLGLLKIPAWGTQPYLPSYCFAGDCAVGEEIYEAMAPRLRSVPEQQMLVVSNPLDSIQAGDAFFADDASFINELRASYCRTRDLNGIQYFFTSVSDKPVHVVSLRPELWTSAVDGEVMRDWFTGAIESPDAVQDRVEEADFVTAVPGVKAYPCDVAP